MKINQYETTENLQNIKLLGANDSQTVGIPFETAKEQMFKNVNATPEKDGLMSKEDKVKLDGLVETTNMEAVVKSLILASHPIGSIEVNVSGINPGTYLGGTWVTWGSGLVPVGIDINDTNFNTVEKTGGAESCSHTHNVASHSHSINSHEHSINSHTHGINSHAHGMSHSHAIASHSHTVNSHNHTQTMNFHSSWTKGPGWEGLKYTEAAESVPTSVIYTGSSSPDTNGVTLNTGTSSVASTDSVGLTTNGSGALSTNGSGTLNTNGSGTLTTEAGSINILQPYITCYMWKRTE